MFSKMSIKTKLIAVIGFMSILLVAVGFLGLRGMSTFEVSLRVIV